MIKALKVGALAVGIAAGFAMAQSAEAGTLNITADTTNFTGGIGGGEFGVSNVSPANSFQTAGSPMKIAAYDFQTFCVEGGADLAGQQPFNWSLSTKVNNTGTSLNAATAYLYTQFWFGNTFTATGKSMLSDGSGIDNSSSSTTHTYTYNYTQGSNRISSANDVQEAIWWFMGQWQAGFGGLSSGAQNLVNIATLQTSSGGAWNSQFGSSGLGSLGAVRILVLTGQDGSAKQDVLVLVPVPLPSSALLGLGLMAGLGAIGIVRRRRSQTLA